VRETVSETILIAVINKSSALKYFPNAVIDRGTSVGFIRKHSTVRHTSSPRADPDGHDAVILRGYK
jgi:hypothetical protein